MHHNFIRTWVTYITCLYVTSKYLIQMYKNVYCSHLKSYWPEILFRSDYLCADFRKMRWFHKDVNSCFEALRENLHKFTYSKTCVKRPLSNRPKIGFLDQLSLNAGQKYWRMLQGEHSAILSTFIKLPLVTIFSPSYTFPILATTHHDSSWWDLCCKIGMVRTENSEIPTMSHDVPTVSLRLLYDSWRCYYDATTAESRHKRRTVVLHSWWVGMNLDESGVNRVVRWYPN